MGIKGRVQRNTVANRGWQGRTGGDRGLQLHIEDVTRGCTGDFRVCWECEQGVHMGCQGKHRIVILTGVLRASSVNCTFFLNYKPNRFWKSDKQ